MSQELEAKVAMLEQLVCSCMAEIIQLKQQKKQQFAGISNTFTVYEEQAKFADAQQQSSGLNDTLQDIGRTFGDMFR